MKSANPDIQLSMFLSIKKAVKEHREKTGANKPLHLILSSKDFKRMRGMPGMKRKVHHYATIPEGTFYLSETKPNPKDYE